LSKNRQIDKGMTLRGTKDMSAKHGDPLVHYLEDKDPKDHHQTLSLFASLRKSLC